MGIAIAYLLPKPYEQISLFPFPLQHLSLGTESAGSATSDTAPLCPSALSAMDPEWTLYSCVPALKPPVLRLFPFFPQGKFLSSAFSFLLQLHPPSQPCTPRFPARIVPVGNTCIAATAAVFPCPAQPPRGLWVL